MQPIVVAGAQRELFFAVHGQQNVVLASMRAVRDSALFQKVHNHCLGEGSLAYLYKVPRKSVEDELL